MNWFQTVFSFSGEIRRARFAAGLATALAILAGGVFGSFQLLAPLSYYLRPLGFNAGSIQTGLFVMLLALTSWMAMTLLAKRLRDLNQPGWIAPLAVFPPLLVAIADGMLTIRPLFVIDPMVRDLVYFFCGGLLIVGVVEGLLVPSRSPEKFAD